MATIGWWSLKPQEPPWKLPRFAVSDSGFRASRFCGCPRPSAPNPKLYNRGRGIEERLHLGQRHSGLPDPWRGIVAFGFGFLDRRLRV